MSEVFKNRVLCDLDKTYDSISANIQNILNGRIKSNRLIYCSEIHKDTNYIVYMPL